MADDDGAKSAPAKGTIAVAIIGVIGSIAVAWITTQAKFKNELDAKEKEVAQMKADLDATERRMTERQKELDAKVSAVDDKMKKLDLQIELAQGVIEKLGKVPSLFGGKKSAEGGPFPPKP